MKPILFSTSMVRAILDGRKTMTRRVIKNPPWGMHNWDYDEDGGFEARCGNGGAGGIFLDWNEPLKPPYKPGDILYVRETWVDTVSLPLDCAHYGINDKYMYKANCLDDINPPWKWKPSIHMPKEAARIFLKVIDVRVERVQDISEDEAVAEGFSGFEDEAYLVLPSEEFAQYWDSLDAKRGFGWDENPWVWVIEFERIKWGW